MGGTFGAAPLPEEYWRAHDQFVALAACAVVTSKLRLGTGITLVAQRDPIWLAKEVARLDMISGGRFELSIGYGWCVEEMCNHQLDYKRRREILRENMLLMRELWTKDEANFSGDHIQVEKSWAWPKPTQRPHPPILMGGAARPKTADHIAEFRTGWMPIGRAYDFDGGLKEVHTACARRGRDPQSLSLGMFFMMPPKDADQLKSLADKGVTRAILPVPPGSAAEVLPLLDKYAKFV